MKKALAILLTVSACSGDDSINHLPDAPEVGDAPGTVDAPDAPPPPKGTLAGQVVVSGPLRYAQVSIDRIDEAVIGHVTEHVADAQTDGAGRFSVAVGARAGIFRITTRGGSFDDLATGAPVDLVDANELHGLALLAVGEGRDDVLVGPVSHMIDARTTWKRASQSMTLDAAFADSSQHLGDHFGHVDWNHMRVGALDASAPSLSDPLRAAFVHAGFSYLAHAAGTNAFALADAFAEDLGDDTFDGNDDNAMTGGLQVGSCAAGTACSTPTTGCATGACRPACDLYAGTPRTRFAAAIVEASQQASNQTGIAAAEILAFARAINDNDDPDLFASCVESLDLAPPVLAWDIAPADGAYIRGSLVAKASATDDGSLAPIVAIDNAPDLDGNATDASARVAIDTLAHSDGPFELVATARDYANHDARITRSIIVDNTAPSLSISNIGFIVSGSTWWTDDATPMMTGNASDAALAGIDAVIAGAHTPATITGSTWTAALTTIAPTGTTVAIVATDRAGNARTVSQLVRADLAPPVLAWDAITPTAPYVRGPINVKVNATDDSPIVVVHYDNGLGDADGNFDDASARITLSSDGPITVAATAVDVVGREAHIARSWVIDSTNPAVTFDTSSLVYASGSFWTNDATPTLTGTVTETNPASVEAVVNSTHVTGTITGSTYSITLPANTLPSASSLVTITVTDRAGNTGSASEMIATDLTAPAVTTPSSLVRDESLDTITFASSVPQHTHNGIGADLAQSGSCATIKKFAYLLDATSPASIGENPRNPILYRATATDDGIGLTAREYRIGRRSPSATTWLTAWTALPANNQFGVYRSIAGFGTSATYDVEIRATDRFARTTTVARCFALTILDAPLAFQSATVTHGYQLRGLSMSPGSTNDLLAARLLNGAASTGVSIAETLVTNGTPEDAMLNVKPGVPSTIDTSVAWVQHALDLGTQATNLACPTATTGNCAPPASMTNRDWPETAATPAASFTVRVFDFTGNTVGAELAPCSGCSTTQFILPRNTGSPKTYIAMILLARADSLQPTSATAYEAPPFFDTTIGSTRISGRVYANVVGCTKVSNIQGNWVCTQTHAYTPYRAVTSAAIKIGAMSMLYQSGNGSAFSATSVAQSSAGIDWYSSEDATTMIDPH